MTGHSTTLGAFGTGFWFGNVLLVAEALYLAGVTKLHGRGDAWPRRRTVALTAGLLCVGAGVLRINGSITTFAGHAAAHLLLAMLGPLLLALSAPVTLALRTLPSATRRRLLTVLSGPVVGVLTRAPLVLVFELGGLYAYYLTPLYAIAAKQEWLHGLLQLHMIAAGCLLSWYVTGRDRVAALPSMRARLLVLFLAAAGHDLLAKLLVAHRLPVGGGDDGDLMLGAQVLYYGGFAVELLLAVALMTSWYQRTGRAWQHHRRRAALLG